MQGNVCFSASFNVLYLAISEKVLTHTHTHRTWRNIILSLRLRAHVERSFPPVERGDFIKGKGRNKRSLCSLFHALLLTLARAR